MFLPISPTPPSGMMRMGCAREFAARPCARSDGCSGLWRLLNQYSPCMMLGALAACSPQPLHGGITLATNLFPGVRLSCSLHSIADIPPHARNPPDSPQRDRRFLLPQELESGDLRALG